MDINNLKAFIAVADKRSFSRSAESLQLTQPAVSKRIAALESELSARLFDRIGRTVHLTEAGNVLLPSARQISAELARIEDVICNLGQSVSGKLSIGTSPHIGVHHLANILKHFRSNFPSVDLDIHFDNSISTMASVEEGIFEMALCAIHGSISPKLHEIEIWSEKLQVVVAPDHPLVTDETASFELLMKCPAVLPNPPSAFRAVIDQALSIQDAKASVSLGASDLETLKMMISIGLGWGCLPEKLIDDSLVVLDIPELKISQKISLIRHQDRTLSRAAQAFIDTLPAAKVVSSKDYALASAGA